MKPPAPDRVLFLAAKWLAHYEPRLTFEQILDLLTLEAIKQDDPPVALGSAGERLAAFDHAITAAELASVLGVSHQMIFRRAAEGSLPCFRIGAAVRFCPATIIKTLALPMNGGLPLTIVERLGFAGGAIKAGELAYILGVAEQTIYERAAAGFIPSFHVGTCLLFSGTTMARHIQTV